MFRIYLHFSIIFRISIFVLIEEESHPNPFHLTKQKQTFTGTLSFFYEDSL